MGNATGRIMALLILVLVLCPLYSRIPPAQARDAFKDADPAILSLRQCSNAANAATFMTHLDRPNDTLVVLIVVKGEGGVVYFPDTNNRYAFTYADCNTSPAVPSAPGQISIRFVDAKAPGFVWDVPTTWKYKSVPSVHIEAAWDPGITCTRNDPATGGVAAAPYFSVQAYKAFNKAGEIGGTTGTRGRWTKFDFADTGEGIKDLYIRTDFCRNDLNNLILGSSTAP